MFDSSQLAWLLAPLLVFWLLRVASLLALPLVFWFPRKVSCCCIARPDTIFLLGFDTQACEQWARAAHREDVETQPLDAPAEALSGVVVCASRVMANAQRQLAPHTLLFSCTEEGIDGNFWETCDFAVKRCAESGVAETLMGCQFCYDNSQIHIETIRRMGSVIDPLGPYVGVKGGEELMHRLTDASVAIYPVSQKQHVRCDEVLRHMQSLFAGARSVVKAGELHIVSTETLKRLMAQIRMFKDPNTIPA